MSRNFRNALHGLKDTFPTPNPKREEDFLHSLPEIGRKEKRNFLPMLHMGRKSLWYAVPAIITAALVITVGTKIYGEIESHPFQVDMYPEATITTEAIPTIPNETDTFNTEQTEPEKSSQIIDYRNTTKTTTEENQPALTQIPKTGEGTASATSIILQSSYEPASTQRGSTVEAVHTTAPKENRQSVSERINTTAVKGGAVTNASTTANVPSQTTAVPKTTQSPKTTSSVKITTLYQHGISEIASIPTATQKVAFTTKVIETTYPATDPVEPSATEKPIEPSATEKPVEPSATEKPVEPSATEKEEPATESPTESVEPDGTYATEPSEEINLWWWATDYYTPCDTIVKPDTSDYAEAPSLDLLKEYSSNILTARVIDVKYIFLWGNDSDPYTEVTLEVISSIKGDCQSGDIITLYEIGGYMPLSAYLRDVSQSETDFEEYKEVQSEVSVDMRPAYPSKVGDVYLYFLHTWNIEGMKNPSFLYATTSIDKFSPSDSFHYVSTDGMKTITLDDLTVN